MTGRVQFGPFELDVDNKQLRQEGRVCLLPPKPLEILSFLIGQAGQIVSKEDLFSSVWSDIVVSDGVLKRHIRELRSVLGDSATQPQYIETVARRGYRFIAPLAGAEPLVKRRVSASDATTEPSELVGREDELGFLNQCLELARAGQRQVIFVTGEPGIGKTALVKQFTNQIDAVLVGRGQCVEQYGEGEAYLPVLEAVERLCQGSKGENLATALRRQAPSWLAQMPGLVDDDELLRLQQRTQGLSQERMLREIVSTVEVFTQDTLLILWLEDLHWSDYSTVDLLRTFASGQERSQLLIVATYRPAELAGREHPLRPTVQELRGRGRCVELALSPLSQSDVERYLSVRLDSASERGEVAPALTQHIHAGTEGNPLFMVTMLEDLIASKTIQLEDGVWCVSDEALVSTGIPVGIQQMLHRHVERLPKEEQRMLEVASVAGTEFSAAVVAVGLSEDIDQVEGRCDAIADRGHLLQADQPVTLQDGTVTGSYMFSHALYQKALYDRIGAARRARLHRRIGEVEESLYQERTRTVAAELATHFEQGQLYDKAVLYRYQAGEGAMQRGAHREAILHLSKGAEQFSHLPDTTEKMQLELQYNIVLGAARAALEGYAQESAIQAYARARELSQQVADPKEQFRTLWGLWSFHYVQGELSTAHALSEQCLQIAERMQHPVRLMQAHQAMGVCLWNLGELVTARAHLEESIRLYDDMPPRPEATLQAGIECRAYLGMVLWHLGYPDLAREVGEAAIARATELAHPLSLSFSLGWGAWVHFFCRDKDAVKERAQSLTNIASEHEFPIWLSLGTGLRGWALVEEGNVEEGFPMTHQGIDYCRDAGVSLFFPTVLTAVADMYRGQADWRQGFKYADEAHDIVKRLGERWHEAELHRVKGELVLLSLEHEKTVTLSDEEAEACFQRAIQIAQQQAAKSLELRATMSLGRLWVIQGKKTAARKSLHNVYEWFSEGFDTVDLQQAKRLLEEWS